MNDSVRLGLRLFIAADLPGGKKGAGALPARPNVHWRKHRAREPFREQERFSWSWRAGGLAAERVNDVYFPTAKKSVNRPERKPLESRLPTARR